MKLGIVFLTVFLMIGCAGNAQQVQNTANTVPERIDKPQTMTAHTTENQTPVPYAGNSAPGKSSKWSPGGEPIDTAKFDDAIARAEKSLKPKPGDDEAKKALAEAYFVRGVALTDARQYASALGDYRRALKYDPAHAESKQWIEQILSIYEMLKKDYPKEGEEPPPLKMKA